MPQPKPSEIDRLRAFVREVREALKMDPRSPSGGSPEACLLSVRHAFVRLDAAPPPAETRMPDPSLTHLSNVDP